MLGRMTATYQFRPISTWPGEMTMPADRRSSPFRVKGGKPTPYTTTMKQLANELRMIVAKDVVVELALGEQDIRADGLPRANARPEHPGVILSFDSAYGPLRYACDRFVGWTENLRAITLGLEALRMVERYGITKRGEQYSGWKQIEATSASKDHARGQLIDIIGRFGTDRQMADIDELDDVRIVRRARRVTHPDLAKGEAVEAWMAVNQAAEMLGVS